MEPLTRKEFFLNAIAEGTPTPPPLTREERYLAKIAENTGGGLPTIEEGDDGKVLTVSSGEAVWASGGGGGSGVTVVPATASSDTGMITSSMKAGELYNAVGNGVVYLSISEEDYEALYGIIEAHIVEGRYSFAVASHGGMVAVLNASSSNEYPVYAGTPS